MHLVRADHLGRVAALVAQLHFDAAVGALDDVIVGEHVAGLVENESRTLALLRHRSIEEVEDQRRRGDVDHRGQHPLVDGDIVLLFGVVGGRGLGLGQLERRAGAAATQRKWPHVGRLKAGGKMRGDEPESAHQQERSKEYGAISWLSDPENHLPVADTTAGAHISARREVLSQALRSSYSKDKFCRELLLSACRRCHNASTWACKRCHIP